MVKKILGITILLLINVSFVYSSNNHYGLTFHSHTVNPDERTSLILTPEKLLDLNPGFSMEFELKLTNVSATYGYVFRMIFADSISLDLTSNMGVNKVNVVLAGVQHITENLEWKGSDIIQADKWMKIRIQVNKQAIRCTLDTITQIIPYSIRNLKNIHISFGRNKHSIFHSTDVPPMSLRAIVIKNSEGKPIREWELSRHNNSEVYDNIVSSRAVVEHGIWEIDKYRNWEKKYSLPLTETNSQIAVDSVGGRIFIASSDSLFTYYLDNGNLQRVKVNKGAPFRAGGSQLIYNWKTGQLYSYSILYPDFVTYNFEKNEWSDNLLEQLPTTQHHNRIIDYENNQLIIFGGYGMHHYSSNLARHRFDGNTWQIDTLSCISPRYLSAMGYLGNNKLLVMGGYGSISGKQEEFPQNYYDLYEIDYQLMTCTKLLDFHDKKTPDALGNSMVIDSESKKIYTLIYDNDKYQSAIKILSVDPERKEWSILGDSIPYNFLDVDSYCDLFHYSKTGNLYAIVLQRQLSGLYSFNLYSLAYPPLSTQDVLQIPAKRRNFTGIYIIIGVIVGALSYLGLKKKKKTAGFTKNNFVTEDQEQPRYIKNKNPVSSILVLGGFQIFNKQGVDITGKFTIVLKQVFLYILLNSIKNGKGVTSVKLDEIFWFGMDKENATNNRSVNIRKISVLLNGVGNVSIEHENSYWFLNVGEDIFCDYDRIMNLFKQAKKEDTVDIHLSEQIVELASAGVLLPNINADWVDSYKDKYSTTLIDLLLKGTNQPDIRTNPKLLLQIADVILLHDSINEDAIRMKCGLQYQLGQKGLSKQSFDRFYTSYESLLNAKPSFEYNDIISNYI